MILGYPSSPSAFPGETVLFHVSTDAAEFRIEIYRQGATLELQASTGWLPGSRSPLLAPYDDWSRVWAGHAFPIPRALRPGVYVAMFIEGDGKGNDLPTQRLDRGRADGREAKALFVLRNPAPGTTSAILYKVPLFTYCAYNAAGDPAGSLYTWPGRKVTIHRPGNGTGGTPWDAHVVDFYDPESPRQTFAHWDEKMIRWLEAGGRAVDYATDLDIHRNEYGFLSAYRLLLSAGHDEYWSAPMRAHVESFVAGGGNVAFFSGNVCYWRVTLQDDDTALSVDKRIHPGDRLPLDAWHTVLPENSLTGVSYRSAGGQWDGPRPSNGGYVVRRPDHWVFEGTGLREGAELGTAEALVGYECDGAEFATGADGVPLPTGNDCSPLDFEILATASVGDWEGALAGSQSAATMGLYQRDGIVFTAATVDWPRVLFAGNADVVRITSNVLERLTALRARVSGPFPARCGRAVAAEGEVGTFYVDTRALPAERPLSYRWSASAGIPGPTNGPTLSLTLPRSRAPVTISVAVASAPDAASEGVSAFGTLTVHPYTAAELTWFQMTCEVEQLNRRGHAPEVAQVHPGEGALCLPAGLVSPLDPELPFVGRPEPPPEARDVTAILRAAERLAELARRLLGQLGGST